MKKLIYIAAAFAALAFTACNAEKDIDMDTFGGKGLEFAHFLGGVDSWIVSAEDESFTHDITVAQTYAYDTDFTYNISLGENTTAKEGTDFSIPQKSVTIKAGEYTATFPVKILYDSCGEMYNIEFVLETEKISPAYGNTLLVSVATDKVTIDWAWLEGKWTAQDYCYYDGANAGDPYSITITKVDETNCIVANLWGLGDAQNAVVDFAARTITFEPLHDFGVLGYDAHFIFVAVDPATDYDLCDPYDTPVVATMSPSGIVIDNWDLYMSGGAYDGYTYGGGYCTTLTR